MWTDEDRAYALAWQEYARDTCTCGHQLAVSTAREHQFAYGGEVVRCHACAAQQRAMRKHTDAGGDPAGILVRMIRTPD